MMAQEEGPLPRPKCRGGMTEEEVMGKVGKEKKKENWYSSKICTNRILFLTGETSKVASFRDGEDSR